LLQIGNIIETTGYVIAMSTVNPYVIAHTITKKRQSRNWSPFLICIGALVAAPLAEPSLLFFLAVGGVNAGVEQLALRLGALVAGIMSLQTYTDIVRSPERGIISLHPLLPKFYLHAVTKRTLQNSICWPIALGLLITPMIVRGAVDAWLWMLLIIFASWLGGIGVGYAVNLGSIWVSRNTEKNQWLDAIRGSNPREQAAFIYAPGIALAVLGISIAFAAGGARAALDGKIYFGLLILMPLFLGVIGFFIARGLVSTELVRAVALLEEIDSHWKRVNNLEDDNEVYLDWLAKESPERLRALRHGWRNHRLYPNLGWFCGALSAIAVWGGQNENGLMVAALGIVMMGSISPRLAAGDPDWLNTFLGVDQLKVMFARATITILYSLGILIPLVCMLVLKGEKTMLFPIMIMTGAIVVCSFLGAVCAKHLKAKGNGLYIPLAVVLWAIILRVL
jgi:hypothetical protein